MPPAPMYESFAAVTLLVLGLLVVLARASQAMFEEGEDEREDRRNRDGSGIPATGAARVERHAETGQSRAERIEREVLDDDEFDESQWDEGTGTMERDESDETPWTEQSESGESPWGENRAEADARRAREDGVTEFSTSVLLANVALSQGVFGAALVGAAWLADVPPGALGVTLGDPWSVGPPAVAVGAGVGVALYLANEVSAKLVDAAGVEYTEGLRESLAPDTLGGWAVLLGLVLPVIAGFEELLFRAALVGAFATGFGVSPWLLAVLSTVAFAIGHGAQGTGGVVVTGLLGFALAAAFVLTGSLLVVVVAHYLVNALEFVVHEGLDVEWV